MTPELYGGFEELGSGVKLATAEKALFDIAYLSSGRSRLFTTLPELEIPEKLRRRELGAWLKKVPSERSRTIVMRSLERLLGSDWQK